MSKYPARWFQGIGKVRPIILSGLEDLLSHEWKALRGHRDAFIERLGVARQASSLDQMVRDQIDLIPESRLRIRRNDEVRRQILFSMNTALRNIAQGTN